MFVIPMLSLFTLIYCIFFYFYTFLFFCIYFIIMGSLFLYFDIAFVVPQQLRIEILNLFDTLPNYYSLAQYTENPPVLPVLGIPLSLFLY